MRLLPRDTAFFDLFERAADNAHQGAKALEEMCTNFERVEEKAKRIKEIEHAGDNVTHETMDRLNRTFVTPLEREDIHSLISRIDDILDLVDAAASRLYLYEVKRPTEEAKMLVSVIVRSAETVKKTVALLRNLRAAPEIQQHCIEINRLENEGDDVLRLALKRLFEEEKDPIQVIKWKEIYETLERAVDKCEDVADVIQAILLKHA